MPSLRRYEHLYHHIMKMYFERLQIEIQHKKNLATYTNWDLLLVEVIALWYIVRSHFIYSLPHKNRPYYFFKNRSHLFV